MKTSNLYIIGLISLLLVNCKEFDDFNGIEKNDYRVKSILSYNDQGEEIGRDIFNYENDRIVLWQWFSKNENGESEENWKIVINYIGNNIEAVKYYKVHDVWKRHNKSTFKIRDNHIYEELKSRYDITPCDDCWKYSYTYSDTLLIGWKSFIKTGDDSWENLRKGENIYKNGNLTEYKTFEMEENNVWEPIYKRTYSCKNGRVNGWQGSIYNADNKWIPEKKIEFLYANNKISSINCSMWDASEGSWFYFGSLTFQYDDNNCLIEETSSKGCRTVYEYEKGHGNAALFYYEVVDFVDAKPIILKDCNIKLLQ